MEGERKERRRRRRRRRKREGNYLYGNTAVGSISGNAACAANI